MSNSLHWNELHQPDVDVLPAAGLAAVDGDRVLARLQCGGGFLRDRPLGVRRSCSRPRGRRGTPLMYTSASSSWWIAQVDVARTAFRTARPSAAARCPAFSTRCRTTAPGVSFVPKPPGPASQPPSSKSGFSQPSAGAWSCSATIAALSWLVATTGRVANSAAASYNCLCSAATRVDVELDHRAVVGHQAVDLDFDVGRLRVDRGRQPLADQRAAAGAISVS